MDSVPCTSLLSQVSKPVNIFTLFSFREGKELITIVMYGTPSHFEPGQGLPQNSECTIGHYRISKYCTCEIRATSAPLSCKILKLCVTSQPQKLQLL